ncbi:alanine--tRNA ligase [Candidatus Parcubacteria bacterium]|nr:alanine--tRNA ligase [Patescibacteria group bacterium]MBU4476925.1 alanine--tRNA ligase [Patescibacteria group bacterium]MCG2699055.1 alanine--tRNA ligase [Candidatus Parcubacteria bacterium]
MTSKEIREKFLKFMESKGHTIIPSASLIPPETDPTALFTTAGMHPLVPYLMGEKHPGGNMVTNSQKCVRTIDIDEVGDESHLTFFEMLGNWSFGSYFKKEAIEWSFEFLTNKEWLGISSERLFVTVFEGDENAPRDDESARIWQSLGIPKEQIFYKGMEDNWWGPAGATGPCGPDTEMFINGIEIWNDVFMEYNKTIDGRFETLKQKNVDTGMGLERIAMVMQGKNNVYETDLFEPIMEKIESLGHPVSKWTLDVQVRAKRIIADHIRASVFIIADGVEPSNAGRGYVLRKLIRRAVRHGKILGIEKNFIAEVTKAVIEIYKDIYSEVEESKDKIFNELENEEERFGKTLERGLKELNKLNLIGEAQKIESGREIKKFNRVDAKKAFYIYETFGFPLEMIQEELAERCLLVDEEEFKKFREEFREEFQKHQELSRTASAGMFKGGLADAGEQTTKYHTATHLLHQALRDVLGNHVIQKGSNITAERLRFDFSHSQKVTPEQIKQVEDIVNEKIRENLPVICEEMSLEEARKSGALGVFEQKYGDKVKVYSVHAFSAEICGGPHVEKTGELGKFKILKEEASAAGIRRIKAVLE